jgi:hypothetical protein
LLEFDILDITGMGIAGVVGLGLLRLRKVWNSVAAVLWDIEGGGRADDVDDGSGVDTGLGGQYGEEKDDDDDDDERGARRNFFVGDFERLLAKDA